MYSFFKNKKQHVSKKCNASPMKRHVNARDARFNRNIAMYS